MNLYRDDDTEHRLLIRLLRGAGHHVQIPREVGISGKADPIHLAHIIPNDQVLITGNEEDFRNLHDLVLIAGGHHPGILVVCRDNDSRRDMAPRAIVRAIANIEAAGFDLRDQLQILNHWR